MKCDVKLFNEILETRSMTLIQHQIDEKMTGLDLIERYDREAFTRILSTNDLDEVYLICHERLTDYHREQCLVLKEWLNKKKSC